MELTLSAPLTPPLPSSSRSTGSRSLGPGPFPFFFPFSFPFSFLFFPFPGSAWALPGPAPPQAPAPLSSRWLREAARPRQGVPAARARPWRPRCGPTHGDLGGFWVVPGSLPS